MRLRPLLLLTLVAFGAHAETPISDAMLRHLGGAGDLPAPVRAIECPEGAKETAATFRCRGTLRNGDRLRIEAKREPNGSITVVDIVYFPPVAESARERLAQTIAPPIRSLDCPHDRDYRRPYDCRGTFADGSRFSVRIEPLPDENEVQIGPVTHFADSPSPLFAAVHQFDRSAQRVECPVQPGTPLCTAYLADGTTAEVSVRRLDGGTYRAEKAYADRPGAVALRAAGQAMVILGPLIVISALIAMFRIAQNSVVARLRVAPVQPVTLDRAGSYTLYGEGPLLMSWGRLTFALQQADGTLVPLYPDLMSRRALNPRKTLFNFTAPAPGTFFLRIEASPSEDTSKLTIILSRAHLGRTLLCIGAMLAGGAMTFLGILLRM